VKRELLFAICLILLCTHRGFAQKAVLYFLNEKNGLSDNQANCFLQDSKGMMWLGTSYGLNRYDGSRFTVYRKENSHLCDNVIVEIAEDHRQQLWIATSNGLSKYDLNTHRFESYFFNNQTHLQNAFSSVVCCGDTILLGTENGVLIFDAKKSQFARRIQPVGSDGANRITKIYKDSKQRIWLCTYNGLWQYNLMTGNSEVPCSKSGVSDPLKHELVNDIIEMPEDNFWVGTWSKGLFSFNVNSPQPKSWLQIKGSHTNVITLAKLQNEQHITELWLSNTLSTLHIENRSVEIRDFFGNSPYPDINVHKLYTDRHNMLWIATNAGIYVYDPAVQYFNTHLLTDGTPYTTQGVSLLTHGDGYWMGGENVNSLVLYDIDSKVKDNLSALLHDHVAVLNIQRDKQGCLWLSTNKGIYISDPAISRFKHWSEQSGDLNCLPRNFINGVFHCSDSSLLIFPWRMGIWQKRKSQSFLPLQNRKHDTLLQNSNIAKAIEDSFGHIWLADYDHGFHRYDKSTGQVTTLIRDVRFTNIYLQNQKIWLASSRSLIETDIQTSVSTEYPFPEGKDKLTFNFITDSMGGIWVATKTGLLYFDTLSKSYRCFTVNDGLYTNYLDVNFALLGNGHILMAGSTFVTTFNPAQMRAVKPTPELLLTEIIGNSRTIPVRNNQFETDWKENTLTFNWAFLNYNNPLENEYFYKMDGIDKGWIDAGNTGRAFYNNLQPGTYTFHYKGRSSDHRLSANQSIQFIVRPPYWKTGWFRAILLLCAGFLFYKITRYITQKNLKERISQLEKRQAIEKERNRISRDMHDELGSGLTKIAILSEVVKKAPDEKNKIIDKISYTARLLVSNLDEMVWSLNPHNDTLQQLIAYVSEHAEPFFESTEIDFEHIIPEIIPHVVLQEEQRRAIFLCIKEFLNNSLKHSNATSVMIRWTFSGNYFCCILQDNGQGFDLNERKKKGNGLLNMESRIREIKAGFQIESNEKGTMLSITCNY